MTAAQKSSSRLANPLRALPKVLLTRFAINRTSSFTDSNAWSKPGKKCFPPVCGMMAKLPCTDEIANSQSIVECGFQIADFGLPQFACPRNRVLSVYLLFLIAQATAVPRSIPETLEFSLAFR